jgi:hypothetical protein
MVLHVSQLCPDTCVYPEGGSLVLVEESESL